MSSTAELGQEVPAPSFLLRRYEGFRFSGRGWQSEHPHRMGASAQSRRHGARHAHAAGGGAEMGCRQVWSCRTQSGANTSTLPRTRRLTLWATRHRCGEAAGPRPVWRAERPSGFPAQSASRSKRLRYDCAKVTGKDAVRHRYAPPRDALRRYGALLRCCWAARSWSFDATKAKAIPGVKSVVEDFARRGCSGRQHLDRNAGRQGSRHQMERRPERQSDQRRHQQTIR